MTMTTWVFAEEISGEPSSTSLEMLTKARTFGGDLAAVYAGTGSDEAFAALGAHGAAKVFHIETGDALPTAGLAVAMAGMVSEHQPDLILFGMGFTDRDVAGRCSPTPSTSSLMATRSRWSARSSAGPR